MNFLTVSALISSQATRIAAQAGAKPCAASLDDDDARMAEYEAKIDADNRAFYRMVVWVIVAPMVVLVGGLATIAVALLVARAL